MIYLVCSGTDIFKAKANWAINKKIKCNISSLLKAIPILN